MGGWRLTGVLLGLVASACATGAPARMANPAVSLDEEIETELHGDGAVLWSRTRPLTWNDFKATAPAGGNESARTAYTLSYGMRCRGTSFQFLVRAAFLPNQSWVKPSVLESRAESERTLGHEQAHFDLTEVYARRMRKHFSELYNPCGEPEEQLRAAAGRFIRDEAEAQTRYDAETLNGRTAARQQVWDREIAKMLTALP